MGVANLPLRPGIISSCEIDLEKINIMRDGIEWYKRVIRGVSPFGDLTTQEQEYMNVAWGDISVHLANMQGIPAGVVSYMLAELAVSEIAMLEFAEEEARQAIEEAHDDMEDDVPIPSQTESETSGWA